MQKEKIDEIKTISIKTFLAKNNIMPAKNGLNYSLYSAPYREDKTPSMKVDHAKNTWYDFGTGEGGDIIDLVKKINNTDFQGALQVLRSQSGLNVFEVASAPAPTPSVAPGSEGITVLTATALHNPALLNYLQERGVDLGIAKKHCKELYYTTGGKRYFGIGFKNNKGGYEIRNKYFKQATSKDITTVDKNSSTCHVFEGFIDYLSFLTIIESPTMLDGNALILNSVTNINKAKDFLMKHSEIKCYLDNDDAGHKALQTIQEWGKSKSIAVVDKSVEYSAEYMQCKDLNDYLMQQPRQQQKQSTIKHHL